MVFACLQAKSGIERFAAVMTKLQSYWPGVPALTVRVRKPGGEKRTLRNDTRANMDAKW